MSKRQRSKSTTVAEKVADVNLVRKKITAQLDAAATQGYEKLQDKAKFAYKTHDRVRASATLNFTQHSPKSSLYLYQKPLKTILEILRRRGENDPTLAGFVKISSTKRDAERDSGPDSKANSRILKALAIKIYIIANGRTDQTDKAIGFREAIEGAVHFFECLHEKTGILSIFYHIRNFYVLSLVSE